MRNTHLLKHIEMQLSSLIQVEKRKIEELNGQIILVKYGGSIMKNLGQHKNIWANICLLKKWGALPVIVHGGGPAIDDLLKKVKDLSLNKLDEINKLASKEEREEALHLLTLP